MADTLLQAWHKTVRRYGARRAIVEASTGAAATFAELEARARAWRLAAGAEADALRGRPVVFSAPNGIGWFEIFLGLRQAGAVVVPLDPGEPPAQQHAIAQALRCAAWWDGQRLQPLANARRFRAADVALIKLTSGSTGAPKPLVFSAQQLLADCRHVLEGMRIMPRDLNYALIPCGHSYGLGNLTLPLVAAGVPLVVGSAALPHAIAADFARWRPTVFPGVPAMWRALAASAVELPGLRLAISAGSPLPPEVARDFHGRHGIRLHNFYGSSETGGISYDRGGHATLRGSVGRPLPGVKLKFGRTGRLEVTSPAVVTLGNARRQGRCGQWLMADLVRADAEGNLTVHGRKDAVAKIGGRRVNVQEIAAELRRVPGVRDVWVGVGARGSDTMLGAAVATDLASAALQQAAQARLAPWKVPKRWTVLPALPLTARGKIDTVGLRQQVFGGIAAS